MQRLKLIELIERFVCEIRFPGKFVWSKIFRVKLTELILAGKRTFPGNVTPSKILDFCQKNV